MLGDEEESEWWWSVRTWDLRARAVIEGRSDNIRVKDRCFLGGVPEKPQELLMIVHLVVHKALRVNDKRRVKKWLYKLGPLVNGESLRLRSCKGREYLEGRLTQRGMTTKWTIRLAKGFKTGSTHSFLEGVDNDDEEELFSSYAQRIDPFVKWNIIQNCNKIKWGELIFIKLRVNQRPGGREGEE